MVKKDKSKLKTHGNAAGATSSQEKPKKELGRTIESPIEFLTGISTKSFFSQVFEKEYRVFPATPERREYLTRLFSLSKFFETAESRDDAAERLEGPPLLFSADVNSVRCVDGVKTNFNELDKPASLEVLKGHWNANRTFQVLQPQRFEDEIWNVCARLEQKLSCLVGCNAYITPQGSQGLAPHHDDVELWVCQTQGEKEWKLWEPFNGHLLPYKPSPDFPADAIGEPQTIVTLKPGDVLYLPRGTIHCAATKGTEPSTHLTISTYQHWTVADMALCGLRSVFELDRGEIASELLPLRKSLPPGILFEGGQTAAFTGRSQPSEAASTLANGLRQLADVLDTRGATVVSMSLDMMAEDFMVSRLPPHPSMLPPQGNLPGLSDFVCGRGKGLARLMPIPQGPGAAATRRGEALLRVVSCMDNRRETHMMRNVEEESDLEGDDEEDAEGEEEEEDEDEEEEEGEGEGKGEAGMGEGSSEEEEDEEEDDDEEMHGSESPQKEADGEREGKEDDEEEEDEDEEEEEEDEDEDSLSEASDYEDSFPEEEMEGFLIPFSVAPAAARLLSTDWSKGEAVRVRDLPWLSSEEQLWLCQNLWTLGLISTVDAPLVAGNSLGKEKKNKKKKKGSVIEGVESGKNQGRVVKEVLKEKKKQGAPMQLAKAPKKKRKK